MNHNSSTNKVNPTNLKLSLNKSSSVDILPNNNNLQEQPKTIKIKKVYVNKNPNFFRTSSTDNHEQKSFLYKIPNITTNHVTRNQFHNSNIFPNSSFESSMINSNTIDKTIKNFMKTSLMGIAKSKANSSIENYAKKK